MSDTDLISRKQAATAICGTCADERYGPAVKIEGSERLWSGYIVPLKLKQIGNS